MIELFCFCQEIRMIELFCLCQEIRMIELFCLCQEIRACRPCLNRPPLSWSCQTPADLQAGQSFPFFRLSYFLNGTLPYLPPLQIPGIEPRTMPEFPMTAIAGTGKDQAFISSTCYPSVKLFAVNKPVDIFAFFRTKLSSFNFLSLIFNSTYSIDISPNLVFLLIVNA